MFRDLKYNKVEKRTFGRLNIPFFSIFGRYHNELREQLGLQFTKESFNSLSIPTNEAKEKFSIKVSMRGNGPSEKQLEKIKDLEGNWIHIKKEIVAELQNYYKNICEGYWGMPPVNKAVLYNFFKVEEIEIKQRSIVFYTDSLFDEEHGMIIEIKGNKVEVYQPY